MKISPIDMVAKINNYDVRVVIKEFAALIDKQPEDLINKDKSLAVSTCRHLLVFNMRLHLGLPYGKIGRLLGNRDHSTIVHSVKEGEKIMRNNEYLYPIVEKIFDKAEWPELP